MRLQIVLTGIIAFALGLGAGVGVALAATRSAGRPPFADPVTTGPFANYAPVVIQTLQQAGMRGDCPMCRKNAWVVHEVPVSIPVYEHDGKVQFPGSSMPMAAMICRNCGFVSFHSLGALNLLDRIITPDSTPAATHP